MGVVVRRAEVRDLEAVQEVGRLTWPPTYAFAGEAYIVHGLETWWSRDAIERGMRDTTMLVAVDDDRVVGVANIDFRGDVPVIWKLYVVPESQGTGAGSALMSSLVELAAPSADAVRLEYVDGNDRAERFYARHGFAELRREPGEQPGWPDIVWAERPV